MKKWLPTVLILIAVSGFSIAMLIMGCAIGEAFAPLDPLQPSPVKPMKPIFYGDTEHPMVYQDAGGWYWTSDLSLEEWTNCLNCHAGRWNQGSGRATLSTRLEWWDHDKPPSEYELFPESPQKGNP